MAERMESRIGERVAVGGVLGAVLVGAVLRARGVGSESLWTDECIQWEWSEGGLARCFAIWWGNLESPLSMVVSWAWARVAEVVVGGSASLEAVLRAPMLMAGVLTVGVVGVAAAAAYGRAAGIAAAWVAATSPIHVRYSQEARMYALTALLAAGLVWAIVRALREDARPRHAWMVGALACAVTLAHYFAALVPAFALAATAIAWWRSRKAHLARLARAEMLGLAAAGIYVGAQALRVARTGDTGHSWLAMTARPDFSELAVALRSFAVGDLPSVVPVVSSPTGIDALAVRVGPWLLAACLALGLAARRRDEPPWLRLHLACIAFGPPAALWLAAQFQPLYVFRYVLGVLPALTLLAVRGRPAWLMAALAAPLVLTGALVEPRYHRHLEKPRVREAAAAFVAGCEAADGVVLARHDSKPFEFYVGRAGAAGIAGAAVLAQAKQVVDGGDVGVEGARIARLRGRTARVFLLTTPSLPRAIERSVALEPKRAALVFDGGWLPVTRLWRVDR